MQYHDVTIVGNLGQDPEMRYTPDGTPVTNFSVAASNSFGENQITAWFRVTAWNRLAETCNQYLSKGQKVTVAGELQPDPETGGPRTWTGRDGQMRAQFEVRARTVRFGANGSRESAPRDQYPDPEEAGGSYNEDEIPF